MGHPQIVSVNENIKFEIQEKEQQENSYIINFECFNPGEWVVVYFYVTGNPYLDITAKGRILGAKSELKINDDDEVTLYERLSSFIAALIVTLIALSVPLLIAAVICWLFSEYSFNQLVSNSDSIPGILLAFLSLGSGGTSLIILTFLIPWAKRKKVPINYPIKEDFSPNLLQIIKGYWTEAITGKRYRISKSLYSFGEEIVGNKIIGR